MTGITLTIRKNVPIPEVDWPGRGFDINKPIYQQALTLEHGDHFTCDDPKEADRIKRAILLLSKKGHMKPSNLIKRGNGYWVGPADKVQPYRLG